MKLHLRIIEADNIPQMDYIGTADPYVSVTLSNSNDCDKTHYIENTYTPKWNKEMTLRVSTISESVLFELKDYDMVGSDDLIGTHERDIKKFTPGIVTDEWITLKAASGVTKAARLHIISHLALDGMPPYTNLPYQFLKVALKVISARDLAKMDYLTDSDPYVIIYLRSNPTLKYQTTVIDNNLNPKWDQEFELDLVNQTTDILSLKVMDKDRFTDDEIGSIDIPLGQFGLFEIIEKEFDLEPAPNVKRAGKINIKLQVLPLEEKAWETGQFVVTFTAPPSDQDLQELVMMKMNDLQKEQEVKKEDK